MQSINDQFEVFVLPALVEYLDAEAGLSATLERGDDVDIARARQLLMRRARTASVELHQFADFVAVTKKEPVEAIRSDVCARCRFLRSESAVADVALLRDVAEAFKHHRLNRPKAMVTGADAVVSSTTGYSMLFFGEGKFGGAEQVVVTSKDGAQRALSSILQNVADAWRGYLGRNLPDIGDYSG